MFENNPGLIKPPVMAKPNKLPPKPNAAHCKPVVNPKPKGKKPPNLENILNPSEDNDNPSIPPRGDGVPKRLPSVKSPLSPSGPALNLQDILSNRKNLNHVQRKSMVSDLASKFENKDDKNSSDNQIKKSPPKPLVKVRKTDENANGDINHVNSELKNIVIGDMDNVVKDKNVSPSHKHHGPKPPPPSRKDSLDQHPDDEPHHEIVEINNVKYRKCHLPPSLGPAPEKPPKPDNVVITRINSAHGQRRLPSLPPGDRESKAVSLIQPTEESEEEDDVYDDNAEPPPVIPERPVKINQPKDEEPEDGEETYDDVGPQDKEEDIIEEDIYEEFDGDKPTEDEIYDDTDPAMPGDTEEVKERKMKEEKERKAKEERERKEKEKLEKEEKKRKEREEKERLKKLKDEEKEKKKKADEEKKMLAKFKLTGTEEPLNTGTVKEACKGGKYELMVASGEELYIIRMKDTPTGKWLVKNKDGKYGYINSANIQEMPQNGSGDDDFGETYDDIGVVKEDDDEQIYEGFDDDTTM